MNTNDESMAAEIFGEPIYSYSRARAIADGVLVDVSRYAQRAGYRYPVAATRALWARVDVDDGVNARTFTCVHRLGNLLSRARDAIRTASGTDRVEFEALGSACWAHCGPGDQGEPVITIMLIGED
ncbi:MAG: DUF6573 family protein [Solirubrobacteraceae bacterium]